MSAKKPLYVQLRNEVSTGTLELFFTDLIYDRFDWETFELTNMVQEVIDKVRAVNPSTIKSTINSLGGDVSIGLAIYNFLKNYRAVKEVKVLGVAGSIASVIAMHADEGKLFMPRHSFLVIHPAWCFTEGDAESLRKQADDLDKVSDQLAEIYAERSGKYNAQHFKTLWAKGDYWMTATEAAEMGLAVVTEDAIEINNSIDFAAFGLKNVPAELLGKSVDQPSGFLALLKNEFNTFKNDTMKILDSLRNSLTGAKSKTQTAAVPGSEAILALVESVLTPFAEAIDQKLETLEASGNPAATTDNATTPAATTPATSTEGNPQAPAQDKTEGDGKPKEKKDEDVASLKALIKEQDKKINDLVQAIMNGQSKPKNGGSHAVAESDIESRVTITAS